MDMNLIYNVGSVVVGMVAGNLIPKIKVSKQTEDKINNGFKVADGVIESAKSIFPNNAIVNMADFIEKRAEQGVQKSEQLYHNGDLKTNEERVSAANDYVLNAFKLLNITVTPEINQYITDAIQAGVNQLGHAPVSEAQKQAQITKVQQDLAISQAENTQLKQKLTTIQSTAGTNTVATNNAIAK